MRRMLLGLGAALTGVVAAFGIWQTQTGDAQAQADKKAGRADIPRYEVDPFWPQALPHQWQIGQVPGIAVDRDDNIWIVQRMRELTNDERGADNFDQPPNPGAGNPQARNGALRPQGSISDCCLPAPAVMQFDSKGNLLRAWGGPGDPEFAPPPAFVVGAPGSKCPEPACQWPTTEHGIYVDHNMNVWLGGQAGGSVLKFTADGDFLLQIGRRQPPVRNSNDTKGGINGTPLLAQPADMEVDPETNELYIADGYTNLRVIVVDANTGMYKRHWGAYGQNPVDDTHPQSQPTTPYVKNQPPSPSFRNPVHAVRITKDGKVYVADRTNDRIQVFDKTKVGAVCQNPGRVVGMCGFLGEFFVERDTLGPGSTWDIDVSSDRQQTLLFNADGSNNYVWTLLRATGEILDTFGRNGRWAGDFHWVHNLAVDSRGNMYTAEVDTGKRAQKFVAHDRRSAAPPAKK
jgi:DNA-binding beta-propeller fold protein YncE